VERSPYPELRVTSVFQEYSQWRQPEGEEEGAQVNKAVPHLSSAGENARSPA